ncbi:hypothetical protein CSV67_08180 [Sporosarcina sp. P2]|uniref:CDP-glycerol glycerophosphotransferase family protein n=1 Tax=Sporosarcina sp. P2 TaxID=2048251 RepID=UPI000C1657ED|nr:CDP-glycerol glycerophosphotransferase family protein [Sporosarcina sp. P2]PID02603.1 hypothetical protein CSV67_08180 [Sporosarcina sp. P2]
MKKIGLFCSTIFHFYLYENIVKFNSQNDFIFITPVFDVKSVENEITTFIEKQGFTLVQEDEVISNNFWIDLLISPYWRPSFELYSVQIQMVRVMYGYAKDNWNYADWNENYDLILGYGPYAQRNLSNYNCISVGNPRYMPTEKKEEVLIDSCGRNISYYINSSKPTILFAPTWGELSSHDSIAPYFLRLSKSYNLIIKAHHLLKLEERQDFVQLVKEFKIFYCNERIDIFSLIPYTDILISDYSGAIFDGVLAGVPVALLNNQKHSEISSGLESIVRAILKVISLNDLISCKQDINNVLNDTTYIEKIEFLQRQLFSNVGQPLKMMENIQESLSNGCETSRKKLKVNKRKVLMNLLKNKVQNIVICGGGEYGRSLVLLLQKYGVTIDFIIDNFIKESNWNGIPILNEEKFMRNELNPCSNYIIATRSATSHFTDMLVKQDIPQQRIIMI